MVSVLNSKPQDSIRAQPKAQAQSQEWAGSGDKGITGHWDIRDNFCLIMGVLEDLCGAWMSLDSHAQAHGSESYFNYLR